MGHKVNERARAAAQRKATGLQPGYFRAWGPDSLADDGSWEMIILALDREAATNSAIEHLVMNLDRTDLVRDMTVDRINFNAAVGGVIHSTAKTRS